MVSTRWLVLVAAFALVTGTAAYDETMMEATRAPLGFPSKCSVSCEGKDVDLNSTSVDCWGTFRVWCKMGPDGATNGSAWYGSKCEGHYKAVSKEASATEHSTYSFCEGGYGWIAGYIASCPYTGLTYKKMMGSWALGTSMGKMNLTKTTDMQPISGSAGAVDAHLPAEVAAALDGDLLMASIRAQRNLEGPVAQGLAEGRGSVSFEERAIGLSGEWKATKTLAEGSRTEAMGAEEAEAEVDDLLHPSWRDWTADMGAHMTPHASDAQEGSFSVECNHRPAWWHGALPCWGNFTVSGQRGSDSLVTPAANLASAANSDVATSRRARALLRAPHVQRDSALVLPAHGDERSVSAYQTSMTSTCSGLWTGVLCATCHGLNTAHVETVHGSSHMTKWHICSGRNKISFIRGHEVKGMALMCHGHSVTSVQTSWA